MNSDRPKPTGAQQKSIKIKDALHPEKRYAALPHSIDELERMAHQVFLPRLKSIVRVMLDEGGAVQVKRGNTPATAGIVFVELVFGRQDGPGASWTAYLVTMELAPGPNEVYLQAGDHLHMSRTIAFGAKDWEDRLIDGFEWLLSDSMRPNLRISR
jgi:hypothetical protein